MMTIIPNVKVFISKTRNSTYYNNWSFTYIILNTMVICSLSSALIGSTLDIEIKEANASESQPSSITEQTNNSLYNVELSWDPANLEEGKDTIFMIRFLDHKTNLEVKQIDYSFKVKYPSTNTTLKDVKNQKAPTGTGVQIVNFQVPGPINISINMNVPQIHSAENGTSNNNNLISNIQENVNFYLIIPPKDVPGIKS